MQKCFSCGAELSKRRGDIRCRWCRFKHEVDTIYTDAEEGFNKLLPYAAAIATVGLVVHIAVKFLKK